MVGATVGVSELYSVKFVGKNVGERVGRMHRHLSALEHGPVLLRSVFIFSRRPSK